MKKISFILLVLGLILCLFLISGCGEQKLVCNKPYIQVGTNCCLDKDDNSICDKDDIGETSTQIIPTFMVEKCKDNVYFNCIRSHITEKELQFDLKSKKAGSFIVEKISLPNIPCEQTFEVDCILCGEEINTVCEESFGLCGENENIDKEQGLKFEDIRKFNLPCTFTKESVDSELVIEGIFYKWNPQENMERYEEPSRVITKSLISGIVR